MASTVKVEVRLDRNAVYGAVRAPSVQAGMDDLADAALRMQKTLVPIDTGRLKLHLRKRHTADGIGRDIGVWDVKYARYVEEGHRTRAGTWVPAQPYIRPSLDAVRARLASG